MDLIIFHGSCPDGWTAAYVASMRYPAAVLVPRDHGLEPPYDLVKDRDVLVLDFSWRTRAQNIKMSELARSFKILDHHKSAQAELEGLPFATFDMTRSGAGLAWDYLHGKDSDFKPLPYGDVRSDVYPPERPWWVNYTEDRDLWNWKLSDSRSVNAFLSTVPHTKEAYDRLPTLEQAKEMGEGSLRQIEAYVRQVVAQAQVGELKGHKTAVLNVPYVSCSEVGNLLASQHGLSTTWFERGDGILQFSLRGDGSVDVSEIAKVFNGGGHYNAAGFQLPLLEGRKVLDEILHRYESHKALGA